MYTCRRDLYNKCIILFICFYACISSINAQNIRDNWFFGNRAAVNFSNINPRALNNSAMVAPEGCATLNDSTGKLLCYTDGNAIWNANHIIINGNNFLGGNPSGAQNIQIIPYPGKPSQYVFVYIKGSAENPPMSLWYTVYDSISTNNAIQIIPPTLLYENITEKLVVIENNIGNGYWIFTHGFADNNYLAFQLTNTGITKSPIISTGSYNFKTSKWNASGVMKCSHNSKKLATCIRGESDTSFVELTDINISNGKVSNPVLIPFPMLTYGAEFSRDNKYLYISCGLSTKKGILYQVDIGSSTFNKTEIYNSPTEWFGQLQLGNDCKIYLAKQSSESLCTITNPSGTGPSCGFLISGLILSPGTSTLGLPTFIQTNSSIISNSIRYSSDNIFDSIQFSIQYPNATNYYWDFGDPSSGSQNVSSQNLPKHVFNKAGSYYVKVYLSGPCGYDTLYQLLEIKSKKTLIVNSSSAVLDIVSNTCNSHIIVKESSPFIKGDLVLLIQMKGAEIDSLYPQKKDGYPHQLHAAGLFEYARVSSVNGNTIYLQQRLQQSWNDTLSWKQRSVQLVKVFEKDNYTLNQSVNCAVYDGEKGGIISIYVHDTLTLYSNISANGVGFRSPPYNNSSTISEYSNDSFITSLSQYGSRKGESIIADSFIGDYTKGRMNLATAGGGGNALNAGGGGGAQYGNAGNGGYGWKDTVYTSNNINELSAGLGGINGYLSQNDVLPFYSQSFGQRAFLGGGGGSGFSPINTATGQPTSGVGGGIIFVRAKTIIIKNQNVLIEANGKAGYPSNKGGASGGGGGGYIHIQADTIIGNIQCSVQGGNGGDNRSAKDLGQYAPGGGGGGGIILTNTSSNAVSIIAQVDGGKKGICTDFSDSFGAQDGNKGIIKNDASLFDESLNSISEYSPTLPNEYYIIDSIHQDNNRITLQSPYQLCIGNKILIMQLNSSDSWLIGGTGKQFGQLLSRGSAGNYEFARVKAVEGNTIILEKPILRNYRNYISRLGITVSSFVINVPEFENLSINQPLTGNPWTGNNGNGGVLALSVKNTLTLNAPIHMDGKGFRGGIGNRSPICADSHLIDLYGSKDSSKFAQKGEGISNSGWDIESDMFYAGKGAIINGGGGGNNHNGGGGGGSNLGCGGNGGWGWNSITINDKELSAGIGGWPFSKAMINNERVVFMGGGGGAGHTNDLNGSNGANGGGIIIIQAKTIQGNNQTISANGLHAKDADYDGSGGGGAAGSIILDCQDIQSHLFLETMGGNGGNTNIHFDGPGGGGGGGFIGFTSQTLPNNTSVNVNGGYSGRHLFDRYGAEDGCSGTVISDIVLYGDKPTNIDIHNDDISSIQILQTDNTIQVVNLPIHSSIECFDILGKEWLLHTNIQSRDVNISTEQFPHGLYYLVISHNGLIHNSHPFCIIK